ncbi:winged helix-turn-helix domain-containing protein [Acidiphilium sp.]|uniref:winged helix-turn-helix domain-containing protein n=2 Tax=unclassified Acidiphilium TaxID=2617493 RepID=UPI000BD9B11A|nr:winged helix-turn-helix domain-containing protein [Acidiphilium sp.]OYV56928.1 MAG: hypothetical protein B7Z76_04045 [Acidiphilium sp. 20-67-58]HQT60952.1 winged helix-turn-helix domain-containing protein [Acidiphilium sp.]
MSVHIGQNDKIHTRNELSFTIIYTHNTNNDQIIQQLNGLNINFLPYEDDYFDDHIFISDPSEMYIFYMKDLDIGLLSRIVEVKRMTAKPIVVISDEHDSTLEVSVLRLGADDYWSAINSKEIFRIRTEKFLQQFRRKYYQAFSRSGAIIRKSQTLNADKKWHDFFTPYEFLALTTLIENQGEIIPRDELSLLVRGRTSTNNEASRDRSADNLLSRIRSKLKRLGVYKNDIKCFNGVGYAFIGDRDELVTALDARFADSTSPTPDSGAARP